MFISSCFQSLFVFKERSVNRIYNDATAQNY